jgi:hypothetical protein
LLALYILQQGNKLPNMNILCSHLQNWFPYSNFAEWWQGWEINSKSVKNILIDLYACNCNYLFNCLFINNYRC